MVNKVTYQLPIALNNLFMNNKPINLYIKSRTSSPRLPPATSLRSMSGDASHSMILSISCGNTSLSVLGVLGTTLFHTCSACCFTTRERSARVM